MPYSISFLLQRQPVINNLQYECRDKGYVAIESDCQIYRHRLGGCEKLGGQVWSGRQPWEMPSHHYWWL